MELTLSTVLFQVHGRPANGDLNLIRTVSIVDRVTLVRLQARRHRTRRIDRVHRSILTSDMATAAENDSDLVAAARG